MALREFVDWAQTHIRSDSSFGYGARPPVIAAYLKSDAQRARDQIQIEELYARLKGSPFVKFLTSTINFFGRSK